MGKLLAPKKEDARANSDIIIQRKNPNLVKLLASRRICRLEAQPILVREIRDPANCTVLGHFHGVDVQNVQDNFSANRRPAETRHFPGLIALNSAIVKSDFLSGQDVAPSDQKDLLCWAIVHRMSACTTMSVSAVEALNIGTDVSLVDAAAIVFVVFAGLGENLHKTIGITAVVHFVAVIARWTKEEVGTDLQISLSQFNRIDRQ
jgi:hypothetical protein